MNLNDLYKTLYYRSPNYRLQIVREKIRTCLKNTFAGKKSMNYEGNSTVSGTLTIFEITSSKKQHYQIEFDEKHPCVFVLSTGRSGTETIGALFSLLHNVVSYHEPYPIMYGLSKLAYEQDDVVGTLHKKILSEAFKAMKKELLDYSLNADMGYVETSPQNTFLAKIIFETIPNVRFIHLVRDPRDVIRSGVRRKWYDGHPNDPVRIVPRQDSKEALHWSGHTAFQKIAWLWHGTNRWILEFTFQLPADRILTIRSEDIFPGRDERLQDVYHFIGSNAPPARRIKRILNKKLNAKKSGNFPSWVDWSEEQIIDMTGIAAEPARKIGYDISNKDR